MSGQKEMFDTVLILITMVSNKLTIAINASSKNTI
jgi:hypothetical protein